MQTGTLKTYVLPLGLLSQPCLDHEACNDPVERCALKVQRKPSGLASARLAGAQLPEVLGCLRRRTASQTVGAFGISTQ